MKHDDLRSVGHNIAASLASGIGLLIGMYELRIFDEAARSPEGFITVDFLRGRTSGGQPSESLAHAIELYRDALPGLCAKHGVSAEDFAELSATYSVANFVGHFVVIVVDRSGRRTTAEYGGYDGQRLKELDTEGRLRPKPVRRSRGATQDD